MENNKLVKIGDYVELKQGLAINKGTSYLVSDEKNDIFNLPLLRIADMQNNSFSKYISKDVNKNVIASKNDIIYTRTGQIGLAFSGYHGVVHNNSFIVSLINDKQIDRKYFLKLLNSGFVRNQALSMAKNSVQPDLTHDMFRNIMIPLPDLPIQKKIADVLSCIDDKIALNNKANTELENMAKTIYDYWFTQFDFPDKNGHPYKTSGGQMVYNEILKREIPAGWEVGKIDDYCELITKGTTPSTAGFNFENTGINFVKVECIENGQILSSNMMYISQEANNALRRSQLKENDILVTIAGRLGSSAVVTKRILPANTNQAVGIIRLNDSYKDLTYYFFQVLESDIVQKQLQGANAQSIQKNLTLPILGDVGILHDQDYSIIKQFALKTKVIFESIEKNIKENEELTKLRDYLLPLLMNGQIEVK